jgi:ketosteroid isomerase-like protein
LASTSAFAAGDDVAALIKRQSQEFSDASAAGDAVVLARYLDDNVIFMNETGNVATKKDIVSSAGPPPAGLDHKLVQKDFQIQLHGTVAVTSFVDESTLTTHGQTFHTSYKSTEVWMKKGKDWKMISSQTMTVIDDPPAVALPAKSLDEYVGRYQAGDDFVVVISKADGGLAGSTNAGPPVGMKAELHDVFFVPGQPTLRRIFERDESGKITGLVSRRNGHDLVLKRVG